MGEYVQIAANDSKCFAAWLSLPAQSKAPGVVLIQYICGVNEPMRRIADTLAQEGFVVLVPDLFWRLQPGVQLNNDPANPTPEDVNRALALNQQFDDEAGVADLKASLAWLRSYEHCSRRAGTLGYCLGGRMAYLMAIRSDADANVAYYGVNIRKHLSEAGGVARPLMLHFAEQDNICLPAEREEIMTALRGNQRVLMFVYEKTRHQFALPSGASYDQLAAELADRRSLSFLRANLDG